jgi:hypothetical protein
MTDTPYQTALDRIRQAKTNAEVRMMNAELSPAE